MNHWLRLTLLGVGAMNSPRFAPAGLLLRCGGHRVAFDGGPGAEPPPGRLDAWLVTDESSELKSVLRRRAAMRDVRILACDLRVGEVMVRCRPLMFAEAAAWDRPIRFRGGVGGHASVRDIGEQAARYGVRHLVHAHIGRPCLRAMDAGRKPAAGEWGVEGRTYSLLFGHR